MRILSSIMRTMGRTPHGVRGLKLRIIVGVCTVR